METLRWVRLPERELNAFLGDGGTGVISFAAGSTDPPYSVPVSYGYDVDSGDFHFRLALPPNSTKADLLDRPVSFVTYGQRDEGWRSVVATGELDDLSEQPYDSTAVQERWNVTIPLIDIFEEPPENLTFREFRLVPDELTGRKEVSSGD